MRVYRGVSWRCGSRWATTSGEVGEVRQGIHWARLVSSVRVNAEIVEGKEGWCAT